MTKSIKDASKPLVSVLIPTFNRAENLKSVFKALEHQTYKNFEVVVVFKPSGDHTEEVLDDYARHLQIRVVKQRKGFIADAYNLGLEYVEGEVIAFLDDDAIPFPTWIEEHVKTYSRFKNVGAVSGEIFPAIVTTEGIVHKISKESIYPYNRQIKYFDFPWARPLTDMMGWLVYIGRDGFVHHKSVINENIQGTYPSLLFMGANMSIKREALGGLRVVTDSLISFSFEQILSYKVWQRGYRILYNSSPKVYHLLQKESLGRFFRTASRSKLRDAEFVLTFFHLRSKNIEISIPAFLLELTKLIVSRLYRGKEYGFLISFYRVKGLLNGAIIGFSSIISKTVQGNFSIRNALIKIS